MELPEKRDASIGTGSESAAEGYLFCPWCGSRISADSTYCEFCGKYVPDNPEPKKRRISPRWLWAGVGGLLFIGVVAGLSGATKTQVRESLFYIKDNSAYERECGNGDTREILSGYLEDWNGRSSGGLLREKSKEDASGLITPSYSASGRYLFSLERGAKGSFDLVRKDLKKQETKTLDSGVVEFLPAGDGPVVYKKEKGALYCFDNTKKTKLAESADYYKLNESGDLLLWATEEDGTKDIYLSGFSEKSEKIRLERNAVLLDAAPDFGTFLIQKEDSIFQIDRNGIKEKLVEEAEDAMGADARTNNFYYTKTAGASQNERYTEFYYYSSGKSKLLNDSFGQMVWQEDGTLLFTDTQNSSNTMMAVDGVILELGVETALAEQIETNEEHLYFLSPDEADHKTGRPEYELFSVSLQGSEQGRVTSIDSGVSEIACVTDDAPYYYKDPVDGIGDLYCEGERIAYDVAAGSVAEIPSSGKILCIADVSGTGKRGTLSLADSTGLKALADQITAYNAVSENEIYMLSDYNYTKGRGDLWLYNGSTSVPLESDIWVFFETASSGVCR